MRAVVVERYGDPAVAVVREVPDPRPRKGELLVRVLRTPVTVGDARIRGARFPRGFAGPGRLALGLRGPRRPVLGVALVGRVLAAGPGAGTALLDQRVAVLDGVRRGGHAELAVVRAARAVPVPDAVGDDEAAAVLFGGTTALPYLRDRLTVADGDRVLVTGASGVVGSAAVQLARHLGGTVTAVTSIGREDVVRRLGAAEVVDRGAVDVRSLGARFQVVLDCAGSLDARSVGTLLAPGGRAGLLVADLPDLLRCAVRRPLRVGPPPESPDDVAALLDLLAAGALSARVDRVLPLDEVAEAHRLVDDGGRGGAVLLAP